MCVYFDVQDGDNLCQCDFYAFYAFCVWGFIFHNQGPLQKVCSDTETHARPQLPPGAALSCFKLMPVTKMQKCAFMPVHLCLNDCGFQPSIED